MTPTKPGRYLVTDSNKWHTVTVRQGRSGLIFDYGIGTVTEQDFDRFQWIGGDKMNFAQKINLVEAWAREVELQGWKKISDKELVDNFLEDAKEYYGLK